MKTPPLYIIEITARIFGVTIGDILGRDTAPEINQARAAAIGVTCEVRTDLNYSVIGRCFRGRESRTIESNRRIAQKTCAKDKIFEDRFMKVLGAALSWSPPKMISERVKEREDA